MSIITSLSAGAKDLGIAPYSQCGQCTSKKPLHLSQTYLMPKVFHLPTLKLRSAVIATCPHCHRTVQVSPQKAKAFLQDKNTVLFPKDLLTIKRKYLVDLNFTKNVSKPTK